MLPESSRKNWNSEMFGRLGNRLTLVENMLESATENNCDVEIVGQVLEGWVPKYTKFKNKRHQILAVMKHYLTVNKQLCGNRTGEAWYFSDGKPNLERIRVHTRSYEELLKEYFEVIRTHALGTQCSYLPTFALHVRSGDIAQRLYNPDGTLVSTPVHPDYWLYPTAYYVTAIRTALKRDFRKIIIICEDDGNPTYDTLLSLSRIFAERITVRVAQPLIKDVELLLCADEVAVSHGSFRNILRYSSRLKVVHTFVKDLPLTCRENIVQYFIKDEIERRVYRQQICQSWNNSAWHRYLVDKHQIISTIEHC